jgi:hypothetical protein
MLRVSLFILLSTALPARAGWEQFVKDSAVRQIERRLPQQVPVLVFDLPEKGAARYNLRWRIGARIGPFTYRDEIGDGRLPRVTFSGGTKSFTQENMSRMQFEIRKDF